MTVDLKEMTDPISDAAKASVDVAMLQSMATALRFNMPFSFNSEDMADLLERMAFLAALAEAPEPPEGA